MRHGARERQVPRAAFLNTFSVATRADASESFDSVPLPSQVDSLYLNERGISVNQCLRSVIYLVLLQVFFSKFKQSKSCTGLLAFIQYDETNRNKNLTQLKGKGPGQL